MKKKLIFTITLMAALALSGCGKTTPSAEPETTTAAATEATTEETTDAKIKLIGEKTSGSSVFVITIENKTGKDITGFTVKSDSEKEYPDNMLDKDDKFEKNEKRMLYYVPEKTEATTSEDSDALISPEYTIKLEFSDKTTAVLHQFPFGDLDECTLKYEDKTAFIEYTSKLSDKEVSTKEAELMISTTEPAEEATTEESTDSVDEPAYVPPTEAPAYEEPATAPPVVTEPIATAPPATEPTEAPAVTEDPNGGCIGDGGLFY